MTNISKLKPFKIMKSVFKISVQDWDDLVVKTYGRPYSFQQQDGCKGRGTKSFTVPDEPNDYKNNSVPEVVNGNEMGVSFAAWLSRDPNLPMKDEKYPWDRRFWYDRNFYPNVQMVANDLYNKGLLKKGEYLIDIDW